MRREGNIKETNHKRLLTIEKNKAAGGEVGWGGVNWAMGIEEGTWCNEHWVLYATDESLNSTHEANNTLYVNKLEFK